MDNTWAHCSLAYTTTINWIKNENIFIAGTA